MSDGSNMGIDAKRALGIILGGDGQPTEEEKQIPEQVIARIEAATPTSYEGATDCLARAILRLYRQEPQTVKWPIEPKYDFSSGEGVMVSPDLYTTAKMQATPEELVAFDGCTGFQWGFAANQARWIIGAEIQANPAIIEI